tara:strand:+ start:2209 stop:2982 length:774 start_codon:yes stop_codon:yes gene_type:complete
MATLTYDPSETQEGELTAEEQESLEVGEKLAEQQEQLLAGKFKSAEDLEQGYIELQKKLGGPKEEETAEPEEKPEAKEEKEEEDTKIDTSFLNTLWEEAQGEFKQETLEKLSNMEAKDIAQMYLQEKAEAPEPTQSEFTDQNVKDLKNVAGGEEQYTQMMQWAGDNLQKGEIEMFDAIMDRGDPLAAFFAVQALAYRFSDVQGKDGQMLTGKAAKADGDVFKSQAQVVKAMSDPQYEKDPAYRQAIYDKLERSNINF